MSRIVTIVGLMLSAAVFGAPAPFTIESIANSAQFSSSINLLLAMSAIGFIPFFLMSSTSFLRFVIVFAQLRTALGTGQSPPNPVIIGLSLFLTVYVMSPVFTQAYRQAVVPYNQGEISQTQMFVKAAKPFHGFMLRQTRESDLALFLQFANLTELKSAEQVPMYVLIPAFIISEIRIAFQITFLIFLPFVVIDLIISNILLTLGMFMLSPVMISLPFKILLFVLVDGWNLIIKGLLLSYQ